MTPEEFRRLGHELIDRIADYRVGVAERPAMAQVAPGAIRAALPKAAPPAPEPFARIFADLDALILPGLSHFGHPGFFGYFPANSELASVLGDYLSTGLGALGLSWQSAPALTELEEVVTDWMRQLVGLPENLAASSRTPPRPRPLSRCSARARRRAISRWSAAASAALRRR